MEAEWVSDSWWWPGQWSGDPATLVSSCLCLRWWFQDKCESKCPCPGSWQQRPSPLSRHSATQHKGSSWGEESSMKILWVASSKVGSRRNMLKRQNWIVSDSLHLPLKDFMNDKCSFLWTLNFVFPLIYLGNNPVCGIDDWCVGGGETAELRG